MKKIIYTVMATLILSSCHSLMKEDELIIESVNVGGMGYKYEYHLSAYPTYQCYYSNQVYQIGDTLNLPSKDMLNRKTK